MSEQTIVRPALDAVASLYATALDPGRWPSALQAVADCFGDVGTVLMFQRDDGSLGTIVSAGLEAAGADYDANWRDRDLRTRRGLERGFLAARDAVTDRHLVSPEEIETAPIYTEFLARHGLGWCAAVGVLPDPDNPVWFSVQRRKSRPPFSDEELDLLVSLSRHAETALRLGIRLLNAEGLNGTLLTLLAGLGCAVFLLDAGNRIVFRNGEAERALADGLPAQRVVGGEAAAGPPSRAPGDIAAVPRPSLVRRAGGKPFVLYTLPVRSDSPLAALAAFGQISTIVIAVDTARHARLDPSVVRDLLGLTLAEARVAALVGTGTPPLQAAQDLGLAEDTVRKALKSVFAKTGVSRQTELALLLSRLSLR